MIKRIFSSLLLVSAVTAAYAEAPVVDGTDEAFYRAQPVARARTALTSEQRLKRVEQQLANQKQLDLRQKVASLQSEIEGLRGKIEIQTHTIDTLKKQQTTFYQDLDQRLSQVQKATTASTKVEAKPEKSAALELDLAKPKTKLRDNLVPVANSDGKEQKRYQAAYRLVKQKQFVQATTQMRVFLRNYPRGTYAPNAHYWLGELLLLQDQQAKAVREFNTVLKQFPLSSKVPDARLKLGLIYYRNGEWQQAKQQFERIKQQYPQTTSARLASARLKQLKQREY